MKFFGISSMMGSPMGSEGELMFIGWTSKL